MAARLYADMGKRASGRNAGADRRVGLARRSVMSNVHPPVPDPDLKPKPAEEMADEGDREGPVLENGSRPDEVEIERDPQFARNGE